MNFTSISKKLFNMKKIISGSLCFLFLLQQTMLIPVLADTTNISGITQGAVNSGDNIYNINPSHINGNLGIRHYDDFKLGAGDIANLMFQFQQNGGNPQNITHFVNFVQNQININGIINTMQGNNFYNGHAVFVSPNGMVVGASGVLNVGALTAIAPNQATFDSFKNGNVNVDNIKDLKNAQQSGNIEINGQILARGDVNLTGKNVTIEGKDGNKAGVMAGLGDVSSKAGMNGSQYVSSTQQANTLFNALVNSNAANGAGFENKNGKIEIIASTKNVYKTNADLVKATDAENTSKVEIKNAHLAANDISAKATSDVTFEPEASQAVNFLTTIDDATEDLFVYGANGNFKGGKAFASVILGQDAYLESSGKVDLTSAALAQTLIDKDAIKSEIDLGASKQLVVGGYLYAAGTKTDSQVIVGDGANINAKGDLNIAAVSKNTLKFENDLKDVFFSVINTSNDATTKALINKGAKITAANVDVKAVNSTQNFVQSAVEMKNGQKEDGSGSDPAAGINIVMNSNNADTQVVNDGVINSTGDVSLTAQNLNVSSIVATTEVVTGEKEDSGVFAELKKKIWPQLSPKLSEVLPINILNAFMGDDSAAGGTFVINKTNQITTASIGKNADITADKVSLNANAVDLTVNKAFSEVKAIKNLTPAAAVVINEQTHKTTAKIEDGTNDNHAVVKADGGITVSATTEMPVNDEFPELLLKITDAVNDIAYGFTGEDKWDFTELGGFVDAGSDIVADLSDLWLFFKDIQGKKTLGISGVFNNWAQSSSSSEEGSAISGSVVTSNVLTDTIARVGSFADLTTNNNVADITINAANMVTQNNAAGGLEALYKPLSGVGGEKAGIGASVVVAQNTHNAKAQIGDNTSVKTKGDVNVYSGSKENYVNLAVIGGEAGSIGIDGSVIVALSNGKTEASVGKKALINAKNLRILAGQKDAAGHGAYLNTVARVKDAVDDPFVNEDDPENPEYSDNGIYSLKRVDETTGLIAVDEKAQVIEDGVSYITIGGALSKQAEKQEAGGTATSSSGLAVGAAVNVNQVSKNIDAYVADGADITLSDSLTLNANTFMQGIDIAIAGAFAGGVSTAKKEEKPTTKAGGLSGLFGGGFDLLSALGSISEKIDNKIASTGANDAAKNAVGSDVSDQLNSNKNIQDSIKDGTNGDKDNVGNKLLGEKDNIVGSDTADASTIKSNMSVAAAGAVNVQLNESNVNAKVGSATIKVGKNIDVSATQKTNGLNVATGVAQSHTVGGGAAVNMLQNTGVTNASIGAADKKATIIFDNADNSKLNVKASAQNDNIQVAVGVGVTTEDKNNKSEGATAALGGSFNADLLDNTTIASIENADIKSTKKVDVSVKSDAKSTSYKGAGGLSVSNTSGTNIGAGVAGNLNLIDKKTTAQIKNSTIENASSVNVAANEGTAPTEKLISVGVGGVVVAGKESQSSYTFDGAVGVDVITNAITALIDGSTINATGDVSTIANNKIDNGNLTGALNLNFSKGNGVGLGIGSVVDVINNNVTAKINDSTINAGTNSEVNVKANDDVKLRFLAANLGVTKSSTSVLANGIVNVISSTVNSAVTDTTITNSKNINILADSKTDATGITAVGAFSADKGNTIGANAVVNVFKSKINALFEGRKDSTVVNKSNGNVKVAANSTEIINTTPVAAAVTKAGKASVAANVAVNVLNNTTNAKISNTELNAGGTVDVTASDTSTVFNRGGTLAASGDTAAVGGSVLVDVLAKDVNASIFEATVTSKGKTTVKANAESSFGPKNAGSISVDKMVAGEAPKEVEDWQMTYDISGANKGAVSGSLITKVSKNVVNSSIENSTVTASGVDVLADNAIFTRAIVGQITGSSKAAVGISSFVNVNNTVTTAKISGSEVTTNGTDPSNNSVNVIANSEQDYKTIMVIGGGAANAAVVGSATVNVVDNTTSALIDKNSKITSKGSVNVKAHDSVNVESMNLAVSAGKDAAVGVLAYVDRFLNKVNAGIKSSTVTAKNNVTTDASADQSFTAIAAMIAASGHASVGGIALVNVIDATVNSFIDLSTVTAEEGKVDVLASTDYNTAKYGNKTADFAEYVANHKGGETTVEEFAGEALLPLVYMLGVSASASGAGISGTAVANSISSDVKASVNESTIASKNGLNIDATSKQMTYDAVAGVGVTGTGVGAGVSTVVNEIDSKTEALLAGSIVKKGDVSVNATQDLNLNAIEFMVGVAGSGAAANAIVGVNTFDNNIKANINNSTIQNSNLVSVNAVNNSNATTLAVAGGVAGTGAAVSGITITNSSKGVTEASITSTNTTKKTSIQKGKTLVNAENKTEMSNLIVGIGVAGEGAAVGGYAPVSVMNNKVKAFISDTILKNNSQGSKISASSDTIQRTIVGVGGVAGLGATVGATAIVNVLDNYIDAYIKNSTVSAGSLDVIASQNSDFSGEFISLNIAGLGVSASVNAVTNNLQDNVSAYADKLNTNGTSLKVEAKSNQDFDFSVLALSGGGLAGLTGAAIVNEIDSEISSYIANSELNGGAIDVLATYDTTFKGKMLGMTGGGVAVGAGTIVNILSGSTKAYINDTSGYNLSSINVAAKSTEKLTSSNVMAGVGTVGAGSASVLVNLIENATNAYVNAGDKQIFSHGKIAVSANDTLTLETTAGAAAAGSVGAGGASVNVNILNNEVTSELLSGNGKITAGSVDVTAESKMTNNIRTNSLALGMTGVAGSVAVTSIGNRITDALNVDGANVQGSVKVAQDSVNAKGDEGYKGTAQGVDADGKQKTYTVSDVKLSDNKVNKGTFANVNANVETTYDLNVSAKNTVDTKISNTNVSGGAVAVGASVLVTNTKYQTTAQISGGDVTAENVKIKSDSVINAETKALQGQAGAVAIGGNVAVFKNESKTSSQITGGKIKTKETKGKKGNVDILATSKDTISTSAIGMSVAGIGVNATVSLAETKNSTDASIQGSGINIDAGDMNILATNSSSLSSEMQAASAGGATINALVNNALSNSVTNAIVNATNNSNIALSGDLNLASQTAGINVVDNVVVGSLAQYTGGVISQSAIANSRFNSSILAGNINANNVNINAGTKAGSNGEMTSSAGSVNATVKAKKGSISLVAAQVANMNAEVNASTNIETGGSAAITTENNVNLLSAIDKTASSASENLSISGISIGGLNITTKVGGNSFIDTTGSTITGTTVDAQIANNNNAKTELLAGKFGAITIGVSSAKSKIDSGSRITVGDVNAKNINLDLNTTKTSTISDSSIGGGIASIGVSSLSTDISGTSGITTNGTIRGNNGSDSASVLTMNVRDASTASNKASNANYGLISGSGLNINNKITSAVDNAIGGDIAANATNFTSNLDRIAETTGDIAAGGLIGINVVNLKSEISGSGSVTNITAKMSNSAGNAIFNSNATNDANVYLSENVDGLIAIAKGSAKNDVTSTNTVNINNADIDINGRFEVKANNKTDIGMTKKSAGGGFISIKGGKLENRIKSTANVNVNDSTIKANDLKISSISALGSNGSIKYDDSAQGFITTSGAEIDNSFSQTNNLNFKNSKLSAKKNLDIIQQSNSKFAQEVKSTYSAFASYNKAKSNLSVTNNNNVTFDTGSDISADNVNISMDSNNDLSSKTHTETHHFAGQPESIADLSLTSNNSFSNSGKITSKGSTKVNFLSNSRNILTQDAYMYAEAAIATGTTGGKITYDTNNKMVVNKGGIIASDKDVILDFRNGTNTFNSKIHSTMVSRILFGIPITVSYDESDVVTNYKGSLKLDGEISAGIGSQKYMKIGQDGEIEEVKGFVNSDYTVQETVNETSEKITQDAIDALSGEKTYLEQQLAELETNKNENSGQITEFTEKLAAINSVLDAYNTSGKIAQDTVNKNTQSAVLDSIDKLTDQYGTDLGQKDYDAIIKRQEEIIKAADKYLAQDNVEAYEAAVDGSLAQALSEYKYTATYKDKDDKPVDVTMSLSGSQQNSILAVVEKQKNKYSTDSNGFQTYDGKIITSAATESTINSLKNESNSYTSQLDNLNNAIGNIDEQTKNLSEQIASIETRVEDLNKNPLPSLEITEPSISFGSIVSEQPKIQINGISSFFNVSGSGKFKVYQPSLVIDNYSNSNLIFSNIDINRGGNRGLTIGGLSYDGYLDTGMNVAGSIKYVTDQSNKGYQNTVAINNYFDSNNPLFSGSKNSPDLIFNDYVKAGKLLSLYNESGDISFNNTISADKKIITAVQGDVTYDASTTDFALGVNDKLTAGKNVTVNAKNIKIDGTVKAGTDTKTVTITDDMLVDLVVDPSTGDKNMIKLNGNDNIKALYKDGQIILFNLAQEGGNVDFNGSVSGQGQVTYTNGYSTVSVNNQTNQKLVVNNISNNRLNGTFDNKGTMSDSNIIKAGKDSAATTITSNGAVEIAGIIQNGKNSIAGDDKAILTLSSNNGVLIKELYDKVQGVVNTIDSTGDVVLTNNGGSFNVNGQISNENGDLNIANSGTGLLSILGNLLNGKGNTAITSTNTSSGINVEGHIANASGSTSISNYGARGVNIAGTVTNTGGNTTITNEGEKGITIAGTVDNTDGKLSVTNTKGGIELTQTGAITNYYNTIEDNLAVTNSGEGLLSILGRVFNKKGNTVIANTNAASGINVEGIVTNSDGSTAITNEGEKGVKIVGAVVNTGGKTEIKNTGSSGIKVTGTVTNTGGNTTITNEGEKGVTIAGTVTNTGGKTEIKNTGAFGIKVTGTVTNAGGKLTIDHKNAAGGILVDKNAVVKNNHNNSGETLLVQNTGADGITVKGEVLNEKGDLNVANNGAGLLSILGKVLNKNGNTMITSTNAASGIEISGTTTNTGGNTTITNEGEKGITIAGEIINEGTGNLKVTNNNKGTSAITTTAGSLIKNNNGTLALTNEGANGIAIAGAVNNIAGATNITNNNDTETSGIKLATTGRITNNKGDIYIYNLGRRGLDVEGLVKAINNNINIENYDSDIEIGEYDSDNDFYLNARNITISQTNGSVLNGIVDPDTTNKNQNHDFGNKDQSYKTLIKTSGNLNMAVEGGNIGSDTHALNGKESGYSINASTRDYTESVNVNVGGVINANAKNSNNALINIRAKESNLNIDNITSDGNVMLTAVDWKQPDLNPTPADDNYYQGYSIINSASDKTKANVTARNISLISSNNLGASDNAFAYNQLENGTVSAMAENDLYIKGMGLHDNLWQIITKRGNLGLNFEGNAVIREITAGKNIKIVSKGRDLTIYDLGKVSNVSAEDDILFPHDRIELSGTVPETIDISVLDVNPATRPNLEKANSTLNIYNAYVKGQSNGTADVTLKADNIIAHAYDAVSSVVSNANRPSGFNAQDNRTFANDVFDLTADKTLKAEGFNSVGKGSAIVFDIQGVSPDAVKASGADEKSRTYNPQDVIDTIDFFNNPVGFKSTVYKAKDVTLSLNSSSHIDQNMQENRGMILNKLYADNAYIDTKDLNLTVLDGFITNYGEFKNGNRGGDAGGNYFSADYRWLAIVDNDYFRNISESFGIPVTLQMYTKLTGSFGLGMGNSINQLTKAPVVVYNPYETINIFKNENSFYRLTYKDDKIQKTTTTPEFADVDKATYKPTKRNSIRFSMGNNDGFVNVASKSSDSAIVAIEDISKGGLAVVHNGSLKKGDKMKIKIKVNDIEVSPEVEVVRVTGDKAGLKFINLDKATANKILYMNMLMANEKTDSEAYLKSKQKVNLSSLTAGK